MRIQSLSLKNFGKFTHLKISDIPESAEFIIITGSNGSGKTTLFEALQRLNKQPVAVPEDLATPNPLPHGRPLFDGPETRKIIPFYNPSKNRTQSLQFLREMRTVNKESDPEIEVKLRDPVEAGSSPVIAHLIPAYRNSAKLHAQQLVRNPNPLQAFRNLDLSDMANLMQKNFPIAQGEISKRVGTRQATSDLAVWETKYGIPIENGLRAVFPNLTIENFNSEQGSGPEYKIGYEILNHRQLSSGQRAIVDLLLECAFSSSHTETTDSKIIGIDEPEQHIAISVQDRILESLHQLQSHKMEKDQYWLVTHSIPIISAAQRMKLEQPNRVAFINLDDWKECSPSIKPTKLRRETWDQIQRAAMGPSFARLVAKTVVICEGDTSGCESVPDADLYNKILEYWSDEIFFISVGSKTDVRNKLLEYSSVIDSLTKCESKVFGFVDRDDMDSDEIGEVEKNSDIRVLPFQNIETMLLADEQLEKWLDDLECNVVFEDLKDERDELWRRWVEDQGYVGDVNYKRILHSFSKKAVKIINTRSSRNITVSNGYRLLKKIAVAQTENTRLINQLADKFGLGVD